MDIEEKLTIIDENERKVYIAGISESERRIEEFLDLQIEYCDAITNQDEEKKAELEEKIEKWAEEHKKWEAER
ncbi:MAG: hypothetical protein E7473_06200 [Ruminococcaceae bacterium]|nr:hypothetical protein [Oscillospiraceae bacterium]